MLASMGSFHIPTLLAEAVIKKKGKQKVSQWEGLTGEPLHIHFGTKGMNIPEQKHLNTEHFRTQSGRLLPKLHPDISWYSQTKCAFQKRSFCRIQELPLQYLHIKFSVTVVQ